MINFYVPDKLFELSPIYIRGTTTNLSFHVTVMHILQASIEDYSTFVTNVRIQILQTSNVGLVQCRLTAVAMQVKSRSEGLLHLRNRSYLSISCRKPSAYLHSYSNLQ